jgi:hypothetical protein
VFNAKAYSAASAATPLASTVIARRDLTEHDVQIEILFCGICHSDLHAVRDEWAAVTPTIYPCVPGHEIVGRVTKTGSAPRPLSSTSATSPRWVVWLTATEPVPLANKDLSSSVRVRSSRTTRPISTPEA